MLSLQMMSGWLKIPMRTRACEQEAAPIVCEGPHPFSLPGWVTPQSDVTCPCPPFNPDPVGSPSASYPSPERALCTLLHGSTTATFRRDSESFMIIT